MSDSWRSRVVILSVVPKDRLERLTAAYRSLAPVGPTLSNFRTTLGDSSSGPPGLDSRACHVYPTATFISS
jgi:hypothetical protein